MKAWGTCTERSRSIGHVMYNYELRITNYELRITNYELPSTRFEPWLACL